MPNLTSYFANLQVSATEVQAAEILARQVLQARFTELDLREGTGISDLVIRPFGTLLAMLDKGLSFHFAQNTIDGVTDTTSTDMVDSILSNWFMYRNLGSKATVNARLYFARSKSITLPADAFFSTDNTIKFVPGTTYSITPAHLTLDTFNNEYYVDIDLIADAAGVDHNISTGSLLYFSSFDPYFLHAEINYLATSAGNPETNTQFIARSKSAISTRNLINIPSITSNLQANFTDVTNILPIGYGDPEMMSDQVKAIVPGSADPVLIHIGGHTDVYCTTGLEYAVIQLTTDATGKVFIPGPVIDFTRSTISGGTDADTLPLNIISIASSVTSSGVVATFISATPHMYSTGDVITLTGATPIGYNLTTAITVTNPTTFTFPVVSGLDTPATGTVIASKPTPFTSVRNHEYIVAAAPSGVVSSGVDVTVTCENHGLTLHRYITVYGADQPQYNGNFITTGVTKDTFSYKALSAPSVTPATGAVFAKQIAYNYDIGFSDKNDSTDSLLLADFGTTQALKTVSFQLLRFKEIASIQGYMDNSDNRVINSQIVVRGNNFYYLTFNIVAYNGPSPDSIICQKVINTYLASLTPGAIFVMSELLSRLNAAGITNIQTPLGVTYKKYTRDMILPAITGTITDFLDPSDRTSIYYLESVTTNNTSA